MATSNWKDYLGEETKRRIEELETKQIQMEQRKIYKKYAQEFADEINKQYIGVSAHPLEKVVEMEKGAGLYGEKQEEESQIGVELTDSGSFVWSTPQEPSNSFSIGLSSGDYKPKMYLEKEEYDKLIANQKPEEWSDDYLLIDINRLAAKLTALELDCSAGKIYKKEKENKLSDKEYDVWERWYDLIFKYNVPSNKPITNDDIQSESIKF